MGEAVATRRPTPMQQRLAEALADPTVKTHAEAMLRAGYSRSTAYGKAARQSQLVGTENAKLALERKQRDRARGLEAIRDRALADPSIVDDLDSRDKLQVGIAAHKLLHETGATPEQGDAERARAAARRAGAAHQRVRRWLDSGRTYLGLASVATGVDRLSESVELTPDSDAAELTYGILSDAGQQELSPPTDPSAP